ncbi:hypothetical protein BFS16_02505 [Hoylesella timonensis]|uniref:Uncharacterized protein n=1 Tax=Hoylesella timonensis TaxID=386414 RepID=A0A2K0XN31_9BACT|nr:hypothetical protein BFS16_02505 [Hoylesella timonensis]
MFGFVKRFSNRWLVQKMLHFHRKNDIFCGCKQRRRNEQRNQRKTQKYACDIKKPKNVDVLTKSTKRNEQQPLFNLSSNVKVCNDVFCFFR